MGALQPMHLIVILVIVLIVFGPGKLTDLGGQLGKGLREFRESTEGKDGATAGRYCAGCGAATAAGADFCASCGHSLDRVRS